MDTFRTVDEWVAAIAPLIESGGWTPLPGAPTESRCTAYLIGPGPDEKIRVTLVHDPDGAPTGLLECEAHFGELAGFAIPYQLIGHYAAFDTSHDPATIAAGLTDLRIPRMRETIAAAHSVRASTWQRNRETVTSILTRRLPSTGATGSDEADTLTYHFGTTSDPVSGCYTISENGDTAFTLRATGAAAVVIAKVIDEQRNHSTPHRA
ncbi:hypothetical protein ACW9HR_22335 [Nocardia gipuzkoensis]